MTTGLTAISLAATDRAFASPLADIPSAALLGRAHAALLQHRDRLLQTDVIGIVDFSRPSRDTRFFIVDLESGQADAHLVAHGRGSDPAHTGWVKRFSNQPGSYASSSGAYVTGDTYIGGHGRSMRLAGLDVANSNAESRAIVIHAAWYVSPGMAHSTGKLGRSEGCFAVSSASLETVLARLGPGRRPVRRTELRACGSPG